MKSSIKYFTLLFLIFLCFDAKSQDCTSLLTIVAAHDNEITFNNKLYLSDSITVEVEKGKYIIEIKANRKWSVENITDTIIIDECYKEIKKEYFDEYVFLESVPDDATVYHEDTLVGHTPLFLINKINSVTLSKPGFETIQHTIDRNSKNIVSLNFIDNYKSESFLGTSLFKVLLGNIIVLGGTAAYFKIEADKNYDNYIALNDASYLDKTRQYDIISGIALGVLQINFGVLLYFLLVE